MRLCVIGNSHLAALRLGWPLVAPDHPWVQPRFYGASGMNMAALQQQGSRLVPGSPGLARWLHQTADGDDAIDLEAFDAVLLVGLNYHPSRRPDPRFSSAMRHMAILGQFEATLCGRIFGQVRAARPLIPIHIMPTPLDRRAPGSPPRPGRAAALTRRLAGARAVLEQAHAPVRLVGQPLETIGEDGHTLDQYGIDAVGLRRHGVFRTKGPEDYSHMGAAFGAVVLRHWLPHLAADGTLIG